ncbi:MAG: transcription antitermination factor NusB [Candidatus Marinimicrobia bacterium]|nr:transcription antitermination factor NusB [Candidatus Neomarinimicrobiota bacterium]
MGPSLEYMKIDNSDHPRRKGRKAVLMALYALEIQNNVSMELKEQPLPSKLILDDIFLRTKYDNDINDFISSLFNHAVKNKDWCEDEIKSRLKNWNFDRVALLDRLLLIVAISEIFFLDDVPPKVSISEAIELAKEYSTKESSNFINGVLDKIYQSKIKLADA